MSLSLSSPSRTREERHRKHPLSQPRFLKVTTAARVETCRGPEAPTNADNTTPRDGSLLIDSFWRWSAHQFLKSRMVAQWIPGRIESQKRLGYWSGPIWNREQMFESGNGAIGFSHLCFSASQKFLDAWRH